MFTFYQGEGWRGGCPLSQSLCFFRSCPCPEQSTLAFFSLPSAQWHSRSSFSFFSPPNLSFFDDGSHFHLPEGNWTEDRRDTTVDRGILNIFTRQLHLTHLRFIDNLYGLLSHWNVNVKVLAEYKDESQVAGKSE